MLVLGRKQGETIVIDDQVTVTVLEVKGGRVKLGFQGPPSVSIRRSEVRATLPNKPEPTPLTGWITVST